MSGVLHRLAAQAMGQGNAGQGKAGPGSTVRAAARLAFSVVPDLMEGSASTEVPAVAPITLHHADRESGPVTNVPARMTRDAVYPSDHLQRLRRDDTGYDAPQETAKTTEKSTPESLESPSRQQETAGLADVRLPPMAEQGRNAANDAATPPASPLPPILRFPDALLPAQLPASSVASAVVEPWATRTPAVQVAQNGQPAAADAAGDVHVTIGCIEITAVHEAPRAKQPARRGVQPMTLDDYLSRRQGGRR